VADELAGNLVYPRLRFLPMNQLFQYALINILSPILMVCFLCIVLCGIAATDGVPIARGLFTFLTDLILVLFALVFQTIISLTTIAIKLLTGSPQKRKRK
jgi:hypothetical protein